MEEEERRRLGEIVKDLWREADQVAKVTCNPPTTSVEEKGYWEITRVTWNVPQEVRRFCVNLQEIQAKTNQPLSTDAFTHTALNLLFGHDQDFVPGLQTDVDDTNNRELEGKDEKWRNPWKKHEKYMDESWTKWKRQLEQGFLSVYGVTPQHALRVPRVSPLYKKVIASRPSFYPLHGEDIVAELLFFGTGRHPRHPAVQMGVAWLTHGWMDDWVNIADGTDATYKNHRCPDWLATKNTTLWRPDILWASLLGKATRLGHEINGPMWRQGKVGKNHQRMWEEFYSARYIDGHNRAYLEIFRAILEDWKLEASPVDPPELPRRPRFCSACSARELLALAYNDISDHLHDTVSGEIMNSFLWPGTLDHAGGVLGFFRQMMTTTLPCSCGQKYVMDSWQIANTLFYGLHPRYSGALQQAPKTKIALENSDGTESRILKGWTIKGTTALVDVNMRSGTWTKLAKMGLKMEIKNPDSDASLESFGLEKIYFGRWLELELDNNKRKNDEPNFDVESAVKWATSLCSQNVGQIMERSCNNLMERMDKWAAGTLTMEEGMNVINQTTIDLLCVSEKEEEREGCEIFRRAVCMILECYKNSWFVQAAAAIDTALDYIKDNSSSNNS